jgi:hypothetical protein
MVSVKGLNSAAEASGGSMDFTIIGGHAPQAGESRIPEVVDEFPKAGKTLMRMG